MSASAPLSRSMQLALIALLKGPLRRAKHVTMGDGWLDQSQNYYAPMVVRNLHQRGLVLAPNRLTVLSISGRREAQRIQLEAA